jgi:hypothetical protein
MVAISVRLDRRGGAYGFAGDGQSAYPILNSDLSDVFGAPGLPAADVLARTMSERNPRGKQSWVALCDPVADLEQRDPGRVPRHSTAAVAQAVRDQLGCRRPRKLTWERVVWLVEVKAYGPTALVIDTTEPVDVRAYVRADQELGLLYAQDVRCSAMRVRPVVRRTSSLTR